MAQRPAPKKSNFGASHPIEHVESQVATQPELQAVPARQAPVPANPSQIVVVAGEVPGAKKKPGPVPQGRNKSKAALFTDEEVIDRLRAAWFHTPTMSGEREASFSDFLLEAALVRAREREEKYNKGAEFPPVKAGKIGAGRKG
ncbi:hypothetical protein ACX80D_11940 [Arthrobacter sp. Sr24]